VQLDRSSVPIAMGEPIGGGMFVSNVVLAAVVFWAPQKHVQIERSAFLRDCSFYTGGVLLLVLTAWDEQVRMPFACVCCHGLPPSCSPLATW
jgi:Ca2+/Na+ antiporter